MGWVAAEFNSGLVLSGRDMGLLVLRGLICNSNLPDVGGMAQKAAHRVDVAASAFAGDKICLLYAIIATTINAHY